MIPDDHKYTDSSSVPYVSDIPPKDKKLLPFPIENIEEDLANIYFQLDLVRKRLEVVKRNNVTSKTSSRFLRIKKMQYKVNTTMSFVKKMVKDLDNLWIN